MLPSVTRRLAWRLALAGTALLASCGGAEDTTAPPRRPRDRLTACELTTRSEVHEIFRSPTRAPVASGDAPGDAMAGRSGCAWATVDDEGASLVELVRTGDMSRAVRRTGFSAGARYDAARSRHPEGAAVDVGAHAFWVEEDATLFVQTATSYVVVEVALRDPSRARDAALQFGRAAVRKLAADERQT